MLLAAHDGDLHDAFRQLNRRLDARRQAAFDARLHEQAVHHNLNGVVAPAL